MLIKSEYYDNTNLITHKENAELIEWIARQKVANNIRQDVINATKLTNGSISMDRYKYYKEVYENNFEHLWNFVTKAKNVKFNEQTLQNTYTFSQQYYIKTEPGRVNIVTEQEMQKREAYGFWEPMLEDKLGYIQPEPNKEDCKCKVCKLSGNKKIKYPTHNIYLYLSHYREFMEVFGITDRRLLPKWLRNFQGNGYDVYVGNSILDDVDPITKIISLNRKHLGVSEHWSPTSYIKLSFAVCKVCYNRAMKNAPEEYIHNMDYNLPTDLVDTTMFDAYKENIEYTLKIFDSSGGKNNSNRNHYSFEHQIRQLKSNKNNFGVSHDVVDTLIEKSERQYNNLKKKYNV